MNELLVDHPAPYVRRLLINRPDARNAINAAVRDSLFSALTAARDDDAIRAIIIGGAGGFFCAGGDLPSMVGMVREAARDRMADGHRIVALLWTFPKPVIAAVERAAAGAGAGIALLADRVVMGQAANLLFPFLRLGLVPDWGLIQTVCLRAGQARASQIFLDGKPDLAIEDDAVMPRAIEESERLAALPQQAFARLKILLRQNSGTDPLNLAKEAEAQVACLTGPEFVEGYAAFKEKRSPDFRKKAE